MVPRVAQLAHIEWVLDWGWSGRSAVLLIVILVLALSWWNLRSLPRMDRKLLLMGLRTALVTCLFVAFLQPTWVEEHQRKGGRVLAVVVDRSASMARTTQGQSRWQRAALVARALQSRASTRLFVGDRGVEALVGGDLTGLEPRGDRTDLLAMLDQLGSLKRPPGLGAVVLISDGIDNGGLARTGSTKSSVALDDRGNRILATLGVPIHAVAIDDAEPMRDLAVTAVRASPHAFVRNVLPVTVEIDLHGYETAPEQVRVVLRLDGVPVASESLPLAGPARRVLQLEVQPQRIGPHVLSASVTALPDEATRSNNSGHTTLRVLRDRTRVMHLAGHPSWDTRFLRTHLRADPSVDLISFYVMVGEGARFYVRAQDTTLIPFPTRELFEEALNDFDLVVFQDFQFVQFDIGKYLPLLHDFVRRGGAFAIMGGHQSLSAGGQEATSMAGWLPVELRTAPAEQGYRDGSFAPRLTPAGRSHPVMRLADDPAENARSWQRNHLSGHNTSLRERHDGQVLATSDDGTPLIAVADRGQGRVAVIATDGLWRWAFPRGDASDRAATRGDYHRFLEQLRGWLTHDPAYDAIALRARETVLEPGVTARVEVQVRDGTGGPAVGLQLQHRVRRLTDETLDATESIPWQTSAAPTDKAGETVIAWQPHTSGALRLEVRGTVGQSLAQTSLALAVQQSGPEQRRLRPDRQALDLLARASGGQVWDQELPTDELLLSADGDLPELTEQVRSELWSTPWAALLLLLLLATEWLLRRRWGLA